MKITQEQIESILKGMYKGQSVLSQLKAMGIEAIDFHRIVHKDTTLANEYACAREAMGDALADEIVDIADNCTDAFHARNRIDARKWVASKLRPTVYGDRLDVNLTQTVDIGGALQEARNRALCQPQVSKAIRDVTQRVELIKQTDLNKRDEVSLIVSTGDDSDVDPFS